MARWSEVRCTSALCTSTAESPTSHQSTLWRNQGNRWSHSRAHACKDLLKIFNYIYWPTWVMPSNLGLSVWSVPS